jgi:hypothetical protein
MMQTVFWKSTSHAGGTSLAHFGKFILNSLKTSRAIHYIALYALNSLFRGVKQ